MNLVSEQLRLSVAQAMKDIFDTFSRDIQLRFWKRGTEVDMVDYNYSGFWDIDSNNNTKTAEYRDFTCRVIYGEKQKVESIIPGNDTNIRYKGEYNRIQIQMELDAKEYLEGTERFTFNGETYHMISTFRGLGPLKEFTHYEIILQRVQ